MLDVLDSITERGGNPDKIRASQKKRGADQQIVDDVIALFQDHQRTHYEAGTSIGGEIIKVQKETGLKKKSEEDASELMARKEELQKQKAAKEAQAQEKHKV